MSELNETKSPEQNVGAQTELGKVAEKMENGDSELSKKIDDTELKEDELNEPIEDAQMPEMKSLDCRSECKYITGESYKYANFGFSG